MKAFLRRIRGRLGLSATGGAPGTVFGGGWRLLASMMAGAIHPLADASIWSMMAPVGLICGGLGAVLTGGLVSVVNAGHRLEGGRPPLCLLTDD